MNKRNVLATGIGGDVGQSVLKCLKEINGDFCLVGFDADPFAAGRELVETFYRAPLVKDSEKYFNFVKKILDEEDIAYVLPITEIEIEFFDKYRDHFENVTVLINKHDIIATFLDKYETVEFFKRNNLAYPKTYLIEDYNKELEYPFILKPRKGCGSRGLLVVNDAEEYNFLRKRTKNHIVQEIVGTEDEEYTVTVFSTGKEIYSIAFKRILGYGGLSKVAQLVHDGRLHILAENIAKFSSLEGSLNIQCRKTDSGYIPFEVNPRFSSTVFTRHFFGFQDVKWWLDFKKGNVIEYTLRYKKGVAVRTIGETFFELQP